MKITRTPALIILVALTLALSACSGALTASSWPGMTVDQNNAYVAAGQHLYAVKLSDGSMAWRYPPDKAATGFFAVPAISTDGQLIAGGFDNILYSLNPQNGTMNWSFTPSKNDNPDRWIGGALVQNQAIFAPSADHYLYKLDLKGNVLWKFQTGYSLWAHPVSDGKTIYQASMDHVLYAIDPNTSNKVWSVDLGGAIVGAPALSDKGVLYAGTVSKEVLAIEAASGKILWRVPTGGGVWASPALDGDNLYVGDMSGNFYGLAAADGKTLWSIKPDGAIISGAVVTTDKKIIFGTESGALIALDNTGKILWNHAINGKLYTTPVVAGDRILVAVTQGDQLLVSLDMNGNQLWTFAPPK